jgi:hypothetical protein
LKKYNFHNAKNGNLKNCQISNRNDLEEVLDLGFQPLGDSLLTKDQLNQPETYYPLKLLRSKSLGHSQLSYIVPGNLVYHMEYPYKCGVTAEVVMHHREQSSKNIKALNLKKNSLIIDIGSNDGTLLNEYKKLGMKVIGVEPTNMAKYANSRGIKTIQAPFNLKIAKKIIKQSGKAKLITATNVFAHMSSLGDVMIAIKESLDKDGFFIFENHYMVDIIKHNQYDTIYHEHIRNYSLRSLIYLFNLYSLKVIDCEVLDRYNGSIKVVVSNNKKIKPNSSVAKTLRNEKKFGLTNKKMWDKFRINTKKSKEDLINLLYKLKKNNKTIVGNSCPCRSSVLLNYCGIGKDLIPYIAEQPTSAKLGLYLPGKHIPIVNNKILVKDQPDYILLLAWHYAKPIIKYLKKMGVKSKFIIPLPKVKIVK